MPGRDLPLAGGTYSRRCRPGTLLLCKASLVFILMDSASNALAQKIREDLYVTDGPVYATALSGNVLYIGGYFSRVGPATGSGRSEEHTSELQSLRHLVCRLLL